MELKRGKLTLPRDERLIFANGMSTSVTSDGRGNPLEKTFDGSPVSEAEYDSLGNLTKLVDKRREICYNYSYNAYGNVSKIEERKLSNNDLICTTSFEYDSVVKEAERLGLNGFTQDKGCENSSLTPDFSVLYDEALD